MCILHDSPGLKQSKSYSDWVNDVDLAYKSAVVILNPLREMENDFLFSTGSENQGQITHNYFQLV